MATTFKEYKKQVSDWARRLYLITKDDLISEKVMVDSFNSNVEPQDPVKTMGEKYGLIELRKEDWTRVDD